MRQSEAGHYRFKNMLHAALLFGAMMLLSIILGFIVAGAGGVLWVGVLGSVFFLFSPCISPRLILRMYKGRRLSLDDKPGLFQIIQELGRRAELPQIPALYYIPSTITNAFTVGCRTDSAIGITDGLLRRLNLRELAGVFAHEISHVTKNDMRVMGLADLVSRTTRLFSLVGQVLLILNLPFLLTGRATVSWLLILLLIAAPALTGILQLALSRTREFDADLEAARLTGDPEGLASALRKMECYNCSIFERVLMPGRRIPDPSIFRTHPQTEERVERLLQLAEENEPMSIDHAEDTAILPENMSPVSRRPRHHLHGLWY